MKAGFTCAFPIQSAGKRIFVSTIAVPEHFLQRFEIHISAVYCIENIGKKLKYKRHVVEPLKSIKNISSDADPDPTPDPAIFVSDLQKGN
jgi:hypothetical protein